MKRAAALATAAIIAATITGCGDDKGDHAAETCKAAAERKTGQSVTVNSYSRKGDGYEVSVTFERNGVTMASLCETDADGSSPKVGPFIQP